MENKLPQEQVKSLLQAMTPQGSLLRAWRLDGGISTSMTAVEIAFPGGTPQKFIIRLPAAETLRQNPQTAAIEFSLLAALQPFGLLAPKPIFLDVAGRYFGSPCLVTEYIDGRMDFSQQLSHKAISQFAVQLAKIHAISTPQLRLDFLPELAQVFASSIKQRPDGLHQELAEGKIRTTLESAWPIPQENPNTLLHGDYWPGNVLWQNDRLAAVIDWEDAGFGDPLVDLAISRLDALWIFGHEAMQIFTQEYLSNSRIDVRALPYWDLFAALRLIRMAGADWEGWASYFWSYGRTDIRASSIRQYLHLFIKQAFDKLII